MKTLITLTNKQLKLNKKRTKTTLISIILTSMLLFFIGIGASTIRKQNITEALKSSGDFHVQFEDLDYQSIKILQEDKKIKSIKCTQKKEEIPIKLNNNEDTVLNIFTYNKELKEYVTLIKGSEPQNNNEILISNNLAKELNLDLEGMIHNYKIVGIYNENKLIQEYHYDTLKSIYKPVAFTKEFLDQSNAHTYFFITYKSYFNIYDKIEKTATKLNLEREVKNKSESFKNTNINTSLLVAYGAYQNKLDQFRIYFYLGIVLSIMSVFCFLIIYNSFEISLIERKKELGRLKCIGATKKQIYKMLLYEASLVGSLGIIIGFGLSLGLMELILLFINQTLKTILPLPFKLNLEISFLIFSVLFIILTIFLSVRKPAKTASHVPPIQTIRNTETNLKIKKFSYPLIKKISGAIGELAYKNIKRNSNKFLLITTSLTISFVLFIVGSTFINYFLEQTKNTFHHSFDIDITLFDNEEKENQKIIEEIKNIKLMDDYVESKIAFLYFQGEEEFLNPEYLNQNHHYHTLSLVGLDEENYQKYKKELGLKDDRMILYNLKEIKKNNESETIEAFKDNLERIKICEIEIQDQENTTQYITHEPYLTLENLYLTNKNYLNKFNTLTLVVDLKQFNYLVTNFISKNTKNFSSITNETYEDYLKKYWKIEINSRKFKKLDDEINQIVKKYASNHIQYENRALENYEIYLLYLVIKGLLYFILLFIALISILSMFNTLSSNINLRKMEFSILRSLGMSQKNLNKMIQLESFFLIIKTLMIGLPISLTLIYLLIEVSKLNSKKNALIMLFSTKYLILATLSVLVIILIVMRYSVKKIKNTNIIESIKNENI